MDYQDVLSFVHVILFNAEQDKTLAMKKEETNWALNWTWGSWTTAASEVAMGVSSGATSVAAAGSLWALLGLDFSLEECRWKALGFAENEVFEGADEIFLKKEEGQLVKVPFMVGWTDMDNIFCYSEQTVNQEREKGERERGREFQAYSIWWDKVLNDINRKENKERAMGLKKIRCPLFLSIGLASEDLWMMTEDNWAASFLSLHCHELL